MNSGSDLNQPPSETVVMNRAHVAAAVAGLDHRAGVRPVVVVANPTFGAFIIIWQLKYDKDIIYL
jgi:hypothetical protein